MTSPYKKFREVQAIKTSCYDERSAAFITEGLVSQGITHVRLNETIKAAIVVDMKEGADQTIVYTFNEDNLLKGDYFIYDDVYYVVYEEVKLTDSTLIWKKQLALECNVIVTVGSVNYRGYFLSSLRQKSFNTLENNLALLADQKSLIIMPTNSIFKIDLEIQIGSKGWKIIDYDNISNDSISYLYLERTSLSTETLETYTPEDADILHPMVEYTFDTLEAYFVTSVEVNIISRSLTSIVFTIPFGVTSIDITTKSLVEEVITIGTLTYEVTT